MKNIYLISILILCSIFATSFNSYSQNAGITTIGSAYACPGSNGGF